jgi:hypothetical protein
VLWSSRISTYGGGGVLPRNGSAGLKIGSAGHGSGSEVGVVGHQRVGRANRTTGYRGTPSLVRRTTTLRVFAIGTTGGRYGRIARVSFAVEPKLRFVARLDTPALHLHGDVVPTVRGTGQYPNRGARNGDLRNDSPRPTIGRENHSRATTGPAPIG